MHKLNWNSHQLTHGWQRGVTAFYYGLGLDEADFDRAQVGIGVPLLDGNLCNVHAYATAPDIAGQGIINPTANLLSACMMLEHLDLLEPADRIRAAIASVYADGKDLTPDQGGSASTLQFCNIVLNNY